MPRHAVQTRGLSKGVIAYFAILLIVVVSAATGWGW